MTSKLVLLGEGESLQNARAVVEQAGTYADLVNIEIYAADGFNFILPDLADFSPADWEAFVALDQRGLNFSRTILVARLKSIGYRLARIVSANATILNNVNFGENVFIGAGTYVGSGCSIGLNTHIGNNSVVSERCLIAKHCFIGRGSILESEVTFDDNVTIGDGEFIQKGSHIGKYSELRQRGKYPKEIGRKTFFIPGFDRKISVISPL